MATFLAQTIKFRSLLHQLNKNEFLKLMGKMFDVHQSHLIGTSLFNHFIQSTSNNNDNNHDLQMTKFNDINRSFNPENQSQSNHQQSILN